MRRIWIISLAAVLVILVVNFVFYRGLHRNQTGYMFELLERQVKIVGATVDRTNNGFLSHLNQVTISENPLTSSSDFTDFFSDPEGKARAVDRMKLFFSRYQDFVTAIKFQDANRNLFSLRRDAQTEEWLEQSILLQQQPTLREREEMEVEAGVYQYYLPVLDNYSGSLLGNLVVTVDYRRFFAETFSVFNLKDYQWQWVLTDSGEVIFDNFDGSAEYLNTGDILANINEGVSGNTLIKALINSEEKEIMSSFYSTHLLERDFGIVFSAPTELFLKYIIRNSLFIVAGTLLIVMVLIVVFIRFIKSQKKNVDELLASESMLVRIIDDIPAGIVIHNNERKILRANSLAASMYGFDSGEKMTGTLFPEPSISSGRDFVVAGTSEITGEENIIRVRKEKGETVMLVSSVPVRFQGEDARIEIHMDVTFLDAARKKELSANREKSEYLKRISYELRTPMTGVIGMADMLQAKKLPGDVREMVGILQKSTEVLIGIANEILDLTDLESGNMVVDETPVFIRDEIKYCTDLLRMKLDPKVSLEIIIDKSLPQSIISDTYRIRQILTNLLDNSASNTAEGKITLTCSCEKGGAGIVVLHFEITDTGKRIPEEEIEKLFGDIVSLDSRIAGKEDSTGLGTMIARKLISLMGGDLNAGSPSGMHGDKGTRISFTINTYSNDRAMKDLNPEEITSFEKIRALVVTGSQRRDEELLGLLHRMGITVSVTTYTRTTINQIKANVGYADDRYKLLVIMDENDLNGFEVVQSLWENNLTEKFIMLLISAQEKKGNLHRSVSMGVDHYIVKPVDYNLLRDRIHESFPFIESNESPVDLESIKPDLKILVVEDNKMNQKVLVTMLGSLGYACDVAEDGYQGLTKARSGKYDLVFMDLILPEIDGFEAARKIAAEDKSVLIVAFTADSMPESRKKAELAGIRDYLSKPVKIDDIKHLLARHFRL